MERHQHMTTHRTVLVTGAAGLIGNSVLEQLAGRDDRVVAIDRNAGTHAEVTILDCDLRDTHRLHAIASETSPDSIIHCGGHSGPMVARDNSYDLVSVNVIGTANMLELARIRKMRRFIYCSSASVYGSTTSRRVYEDVALHPSTVYGATKLAAEQIVLSYGREHGIDAAALRLAWVYGPNRTTACILRTMIADALAGRPTRIGWGADFYRQYVHANDAAAALIAALDAPSLKQRVYTITGGSYLTLGEIAELVTAALPGADIRLQTGPDPDDDVHHEFDISAARSELGYEPRISLQDGILGMVQLAKG